MLTGSDTSNNLSLIFKEMFIGGNFFLKIFSYFSKSVFCSDFHSHGATECREKAGLQPHPPAKHMFHLRLKLSGRTEKMC